MRIFSPRGKLFNTVNLNPCLSLRWSYQFYHFPSVCPDIIIAWDSGTHSNSRYFRHHSRKQQSTANDWQSSSCCLRGVLSRAGRPGHNWRLCIERLTRRWGGRVWGQWHTHKFAQPFWEVYGRGGWENEETYKDTQSQDIGKCNGANFISMNVSHFFPPLPYVFKRLFVDFQTELKGGDLEHLLLSCRRIRRIETIELPLYLDFPGRDS